VKVLIWNIQNFTLRRVLDSTGATPNAQADSLDRSLANWTYITRTVSDADPDLFVVIEPRCDQGTLGELASGNGVAALLVVLLGLRQVLSPQWMLIPPLRVNPVMYNEVGEVVNTRSETVGFFWNDAKLQFTGPWIWPQANQDTGPPRPPGAAAANYPAMYNGVIVPAGTQAAPLWAWFNPGWVDFPGRRDRRPLVASFVERTGAQRVVNVAAFHPSPHRAREGLYWLAKALQGFPPGNNELTLVAGDMNINLLGDTTGNTSSLDFFETTTWSNPPYTRVPPNPLAATIIRRSSGVRADALATPLLYTKPECLDFGWVLYGPHTVPAAGAPAATVVNRVAGAAAVPPFPQFTEEMGAPLATIVGMGNADLRNTVFRYRWNYGHIGPPNDGTSDHLPVLIAV
jgi:hypothetical protein